MRRISFIALLSIFIFQSCKTDTKTSLITERIQYDVQITNTEQTSNWWVKNIDGYKREKFIKTIIEEAKKNPNNVYTPLDFKKMNSEQFEFLLSHQDTILAQSPNPPYDYTEKVENYELNINDISKIRFMEEWYYDEETFISKKVIGVCPLINNYSSDGTFRGYQPLFWMFYDDRYPAELGF